MSSHYDAGINNYRKAKAARVVRDNRNPVELLYYRAIEKVTKVSIGTAP